MLGSLLAGTHESPGETIILEGRKFKTYFVDISGLVYKKKSDNSMKQLGKLSKCETQILKC